MIITTLIKKELNSFLGTWVAYIVYFILLTSIGLITWFFPDTNFLDYGFADLDIFFGYIPYILLFFVPAITMRLFSEENKSGTLELLLTKPIGRIALITSKFISAVIICCVPIIPTLCYYYSLYFLGLPEGNIDTAEVIGSYIALLMLISTFVAIGLFSSAYTENQIVAFLLSVFTCYTFYEGFDAIANIDVWSKTSYWITSLGISNHYNTLSKGLIDIRDIIYFLSIIIIILSATNWVINSNNNNVTFKRDAPTVAKILISLNAVSIILLLFVFANKKITRIDITEDKRFTLSKPTKQLLKMVESPINVDIYLAGDMPSGFKMLKRSVGEFLDEINIYSNQPISYNFVDPNQAQSRAAIQEYHNQLLKKGVNAKDIFETKKGKRIQKRIFPGAIMTYKEKEMPVNFLSTTSNASPQKQLNQSIENIEFSLSTVLKQFVSPGKLKIGVLKGNKELDSLEMASLTNTLLKNYNVYNVDINKKLKISGYDCLIIAKPMEKFSEQDKFKIDQYVMHGGSLLLLLDPVGINMSDAGKPNGSLAFPRELNLDDLLFKYGVRANRDLVQDIYSGPMPVVTSVYGDKPNIELLPWYYFPVILQYGTHPIVKNTGATITRFISSIDTVKAIDIVKTPLMFTSKNANIIPAPIQVSLNDIQNFSPEKYPKKTQPYVVSYLLEGPFTSLYNNRFLPPGVDVNNIKKKSTNSRIIVIADGDIAKNEINPKTKEPLELGYDPYTKKLFSNEDLLVNMIHYLVDKDGIIVAKNNQHIPRLLDKRKVIEKEGYYRWFNLCFPIGIVLIFGFTYIYFRHKKYAIKIFK